MSSVTANQKRYKDKLLKEQKSLKYLIKDNKMSEKLIEDYFKCRICKNIVHEPVECSGCEDIFCTSCFEDFLKTNKCCMNFCTDVKLQRTHANVINLLDKLVFRCIFNCGQQIRYQDLERHLILSDSCKNKQTICPNKDCEFTGNLERIDKHIGECLNVEVFCSVCKITYKKSENHNCSDHFTEKFKSLQKLYDEMTKEYETRFTNLEVISVCVHKAYLKMKNNSQV